MAEQGQERWAIKRGYAGELRIGLIVKSTEKTVSVREVNWNGRLSDRPSRWTGIIGEASSREQAEAVVAAAKKAWDGHSGPVGDAERRKAEAVRKRDEAFRAAISRALGEGE